MNDLATLYQEIDALLAAPAAGGASPPLWRLERTLTDGYACALSLEAERNRLERRIGELATGLHEGGAEPKASELAALSRRLAHAGDELILLRGRLTRLRGHVTATRAAAAAAPFPAESA